MASKIEAKVSRAQHLDILPLEGPLQSFYISVCINLFKSDVNEYFNNHSAAQCVQYCKEILFERFVLSEESRKEIHCQSTDKSYNVGMGNIKKPIDILSKERTDKISELLKIFRPWEQDLSEINEILPENGCIYESIEQDKKKKSFDEYFHSDLLEIDTSGLTVAQIQFVFDNALKHNFAVNILGIFGQK